MEEMTLIAILRITSIVASIVGILAGLDLLLGGKFIYAVTKIMEKKIDFDKVIVKLFSDFKKELDKERGGIDQAIANVKVRVFLGGLFLVLSVCIILLLKKI